MTGSMNEYSDGGDIGGGDDGGSDVDSGGASGELSESW